MVILMDSYLTFMQRSPETQVRRSITYLRGSANDWWENYKLENGYPRDWKELSKDPVKKFDSQFRARMGLAQLMNFRQGKGK